MTRATPHGGFVRPPPHAPGMAIGLFGGTFDPPHAGHVLASEIALRRLRLDRVWWIVTPGNPLKDVKRLRPLDVRMNEARALLRDPRIVVSDLEAKLGTRYTFDTVGWLTRHCPDVNFVWVMGADILAQLHHWQNWREIAALVPLAVIDRPGASLAATASPAARALARWRIPETQAADFARMAPPALVILHGRRVALSSTMLRKQREGAQHAANAGHRTGKSPGHD